MLDCTMVDCICFTLRYRLAYHTNALLTYIGNYYCLGPV